MLNKFWLWLGGLVLILCIVAFCLRQYGNARVAQADLERATEAISGAVDERKDAVKVDTLQKQERAVQASSVQSAVRPLKKEAQGVQEPCSDAGSSERLRLLNVAITGANRSIDSAAKLLN